MFEHDISPMSSTHRCGNGTLVTCEVAKNNVKLDNVLKRVADLETKVELIQSASQSPSSCIEPLKRRRHTQLSVQVLSAELFL